MGDIKLIGDTWEERRNDQDFKPHINVLGVSIFLELTTEQYDILDNKDEWSGEYSPQSQAIEKMLLQEYSGADFDYSPHFGCGLQVTLPYESYLKMDEIIKRVVEILS
jgi:hypothetical protein